MAHIPSVVLGVVRISLLVEAAVALLLAARFWLGYGTGLGQSLWLGTFQTMSSKDTCKLR